MPASRQVLVVVETEIASTHLLMQVLEAAAPFGISARIVPGSAWSAHRSLEGGVTPLFARCADPAMLPYAEALVASDRPYLYYLDDDFWSLDPETALGAYYGHPSVRATLDYFVRHAALVLTNTPHLADRLRARGARVAVVPTFFRFDLIAGIVPETTDEIRIGFAGSLGRAPDLDLVAGVIPALLAEEPKAVFEFIGVAPDGVQPGARLRIFPPMARYESFIAFQAARNWSIGLAPLLATPSNASKTDNKFREYAACSIAGVYSDFGPYRAAVTNGVDGLLVADGGWHEAVGGLLRAPGRLRAMRRAAYQTALARYEIMPAARVWAEVIGAAIDAFPASHQREMSLARARRRRPFMPFVGIPARVHAAYRSGGVRMVAEKAGRWLGRRLGAGPPS